MNALGPKNSRTRALERGLLVVELLAANGPMPLVALSEKTGLSNSTLLRILRTLEYNNWVVQRYVDGRFELAQKIDSFIAGRLHVNPLVEIVKSTLSSLPERLGGWPSEIAVPISFGHVAILSSNHWKEGVINVVDRQNGRETYGMNMPMTLSSHGRATLAYSGKDERTGHLSAIIRRGRREERQWIERGLLAVILQETKSQGYALREYDYWVEPHDLGPDICSLAVPILVENRLHATLSMLWAPEAFRREVIVREHFSTLQEAADEIAGRVRSAGLAPPQFSERPWSHSEQV